MVINEIKLTFVSRFILFKIVTTEDRAPAPREAHRNPVDEAAEQHKRQVEKRCNDIVDKDVRCDWTCHRSCTDCGKAMLEYSKESFCEAGGDQCRSQNRFARLFLLPCW